MSNKSFEHWGIDPQARCLRVQVDACNSVLLPFEHFVFSTFKSATKEDVLHARFATHEVVITGRCLKRVEGVLQRKELAWISVLPDRLTDAVPENIPIILRIELHEAEDTSPETKARGPR